MRTSTTTALAAAAAGYGTLFWLGATWGATAAERERPLPGDELVEHPTLVTTHGITIEAPPDAVWPWLVQMGWGRGGWYTYRWVDRLLFPANGPSANRIVPELQTLAVGDHILDGPPEQDCWFNVEVLERPTVMVLRSTTHVPLAWRQALPIEIDWVWSWHLETIDTGATRLLQRNRMRLRPRWFEAAFFATIIPADFIMARSHLQAIKRLAEARAPDHTTSRPHSRVGVTAMRAVERLTMREAGYLHLERSGVPCTIGWAAQVERPPGPVEDYVRSITTLLASRLHQLPRLRQRVLEVPRGCGMPVWIDDPEFSVERHVAPVNAQAPEADVTDLAEDLFARPVDLERPLWNMWIVEGPSPDQLTIVFRLHHAVADGIGAATIAAALLTGTAGSTQFVPWQPAPPPSTATLMRDNVRWRFATARQALRLAIHPVQRLRRAAEMTRQLRSLWHLTRGAGTTSLNAPLGRRRTLSVLEVPLPSVKAAGRRHGATVNDVLLGAVAGGLSALLASRGESVDVVVHAAQGVSRRSAGERGVGNDVGGQLVPLHTDVADPQERLRRIVQDTRALKAADDAPAIVSLQDSPFVPVAVQTLLERKMRSQRLVQTYIANVPGPPEMLDLAGAPLRTLIPVVPLMANVPVVVAAVSYAGRYVIGVRTDSDAAPDVAVFMAGMRANLNAMGIGDPAREEAEPAPAASRPAPR